MATVFWALPLRSATPWQAIETVQKSPTVHKPSPLVGTPSITPGRPSLSRSITDQFYLGRGSRRPSSTSLRTCQGGSRWFHLNSGITCFSEQRQSLLPQDDWLLWGYEVTFPAHCTYSSSRLFSPFSRGQGHRRSGRSGRCIPRRRHSRSSLPGSRPRPRTHGRIQFAERTSCALGLAQTQSFWYSYTQIPMPSFLLHFYCVPRGPQNILVCIYCPPSFRIGAHGDCHPRSRYRLFLFATHRSSCWCMTTSGIGSKYRFGMFFSENTGIRRKLGTSPWIFLQNTNASLVVQLMTLDKAHADHVHERALDVTSIVK